MHLALLLLVAQAGASAPKPTGRPMVGMAVKPVVCRPVPDAQGKTGQQLADAIELMGAQFSHTGYRLAALLPGDPPIACFSSDSDPGKLPRGAR